MKLVYPLLVILILFTVIPSLYAAGYAPNTPIITTTKVWHENMLPSCSERNVTTTINSTLLITYPDGQPVDLVYPTLPVQVCGDQGCVNMNLPMPYSHNGTYQYSLTTNLVGQVTIMVPANSLIENDEGLQFPSTNVLLADFYVSPINCTVQQITTVTVTSTSVYSIAEIPRPQTQNSTPALVVFAIIFLSFSGLLIYPFRKP